MDSIEIIDETSTFFDEAIGHIQDIVLSDKFEEVNENFFEKHWKSFDYGDENKLECMEIFLEYQQLFENYIHKQLQKRMKFFDLQRFEMELDTVPDDLDLDEIQELLKSFDDFLRFKELMLDYRRKKEGQLAHLDRDILITTAYLT